MKVIPASLYEYYKFIHINTYKPVIITNDDYRYFILNYVPGDVPSKVNIKSLDAYMLSYISICTTNIEYIFYFTTENKSKMFFDDIIKEINIVKNQYNEFIRIDNNYHLSFK